MVDSSEPLELLALDETFDHAYGARLIARAVVSPDQECIPATPRFAVEVVPVRGERWRAIFCGEPVDEYIDRLLTTPAPDTLCVIAGGHGYFVQATDRYAWEQVECTPIRQALGIPDQGLLVFGDFIQLVAYEHDPTSIDTAVKMRWRSARLGWDRLEVLGVAAGILHGRAWHARDDRMVGFTVDLDTGLHEGGAY